MKFHFHLVWHVILKMKFHSYPSNGMDMRIVHRKLVKALQMAQEKHTNCYVIYKEHLHGELS